MSSINTNTSAMNALSTLRSVNSSLNQTQDRISTGLKVSNAGDNAAYFAISETMKGDSGMTKSINESLTLTKNSLATANVGADSFKDLARQFSERVAFAQGGGSIEDVKNELDEIVKQMDASISQATFNGDDLIGSGNTVATGTTVAGDGSISAGATTTEQARSLSVVTGITRNATGVAATTMDVSGVDLKRTYTDFKAVADAFKTGYDAAVAGAATPAAAEIAGQDYLKNSLTASEDLLGEAIEASTTLGVGQKSIENQQEFLTKLTDNLDTGVGAMVDANMEEEAARLQALQVQQQLASQSLSIANQAPQNILSLFR
ncbi:flagellar protein [Sulfitobacter sp. HI0082]|jgi:flagellin|uniref:flagellin N-terminal helical domain-containing protein n=2 Tax=Sulfitobacter TaxID=60136 RepID=UPI0007CFD23A|nr:flagellin [Sulfitobacter sp. OXR-159]KZZ25836.1 flagellar protein [Sulfitobacter sp. HI0082]WPZ28761.1 flagellin [Sulfitobacter sp. OXR-159]HAC50806.1 flagellar protein [Sulfitobacter sp.]